MVARAHILIVGGYGAFGRLLAAELARVPGVTLVIAGRDARKCARVAAAVGGEALALDLAEPDALAGAARARFAVACTAGPFQDLDPRLPAAAVEAGAHWLDIADYAGWVRGILDDAALDERARRAGLSVLTGMATVPALSGALARRCLERLPEAARVRIGLAIGNRNAKGVGSVASAVRSGFAAPARMTFPDRARTAYRFPAPDEMLLRAALGVEAEMRVALEWGLAGALVAAAGRLVPRLSTRRRDALMRALVAIARPVSALGSDLGVVQAEAFAPDGRSVGAALSGPQRMAIVPCAIAIEELLAGRVPPGAVVPFDLLPPAEWLRRSCARGMVFHARGGSA